jgi:hypothetical protein
MGNIAAILGYLVIAVLLAFWVIRFGKGGG